MIFLWASLLVALVAVPLVIALYVWARRRRRPPAARYSSLSLIRAAGPPARRWRRHVPIALLATAIAALAVAVARPVVVLSVPTNQTTMVLAMDVSGSMCSTDIAPTPEATRRLRPVGSHSTEARVPDQRLDHRGDSLGPCGRLG